MIKRFLIAFILIVLVAGGLVGFNIFRDRQIEQYFANMQQPALTVSTTKVEPVTWKPTISAIGTVSAGEGVSLTVETSGVVKEVRFSANSKVEQGDLLLRLDDEVQRADLEAAQSQAELDRKTLERAQELESRDIGSRSNLESAQAAAAASESQVAKSQALIDQKQLKAPFSGTIGIPRVDVGQYISPGDVVATLQDLSTMRVDFTVPEQQFDALEIGQPIALGLTENDMPFTGRITGIDPKIDPATRLVSVQGEISNPQSRLNPGQFVRVKVELPTEDDIIAIPQTALVTSLYGDYVYRLSPVDDENDAAADVSGADESAGSDDAPDPAAGAQEADPAENHQGFMVEQVFVTPGRRAGGAVEIVKGLAAGDLIVNAGQNRLSNGARVKIDNTVQPAGSRKQ